MDEFDKILSYYISHHNKKFDISFFKSDFQKKFYNNFIAHIEIDYHYINDTTNIKSFLLFFIDSCELAGYIFKKINRMIINIVSDRCNMTNGYYMHRSMNPLETKLIKNFAKNPQLLDQNIKHLFIRKYSQIFLV